MSLLANVPSGDYDVRPQTGFSSVLMDKLVASRSRIEEWVQHEKAKAEQAAEEYRQQLMQEKAEIEKKKTDLLAVQLERGLSVKNDEDEHDNAESIANRKSALEEQRAKLESEVEKLKGEYQTREKRVQGRLPETLNSFVPTPLFNQVVSLKFRPQISLTKNPSNVNVL